MSVGARRSSATSSMAIDNRSPTTETAWLGTAGPIRNKMDSDTEEDLVMTPHPEEFARSRTGAALTVLSGANNSGKSLYLKLLRRSFGKQSYLAGVNRFYHVTQLSTGTRNPTQLDEFNQAFLAQMEKNKA